MDLKNKFETLVRENIKRDGIEDLLTAIAKTDFYTAPASTRFHDAEEGGLVRHSIRVYEVLLKENVPPNLNLLPHENTERLAVTALFHDFCKIGFYKVEMRNVKNETGKWVQVPYYTIDDLFPYGHGEKSVYMVQQFIKLTDEEAMAIRWHMNGFEAKENHIYIGKAYNMFPLALYLGVADMKASYL